MATPELIDQFKGRWFFLSNFAPSPIVWEQPPYGVQTFGGVEHRLPRLVYPSVEHAYQAAKSTDLGVRFSIANVSDPAEAKRRGWNLPGPLRKGWRQVRVQVMGELIRTKFAPWSELAWDLVETGSARLVEGNSWHDNFWGDCRCGHTPRCAAPGENYLGETLMMWRNHLIKNGGK